MKKLRFSDGIKDSIPIALGYLSVSFGVGITAASCGITPIEAAALSLFNVTSAGEAAGISIIAAGGTYIETAISQLVINLRYSLMSISLTQKMDESFTLFHRLTTSFAVTDEIYAVAAGKPGNINRSFMYGLMILPILFWTLGTLLGAAAGNILPASVCDALGIALYSMFIAIVVPPATKNRGILFTALSAAALSCLIYYLPALDFISSGFAVIICTIAASLAAALIFPVPTSDEKEHE